MANEFKAEESMAHESMADEFKPRVTNKIPWRMAPWHGIHSLRNIEISEKRNGCNIYGGEILKFRRKRST